MPTPNNPHDKFFKYIFSHKDIVSDYILNFFPENVSANLDLHTLKRLPDSYISDKQDSFDSDIVYQCRQKNSEKEIKISLLFEHKSYPPKYLHFQLLRYQVEAWFMRIRNKKEPIFVLSDVLYHGNQAWKNQKLEDYFKDIPADFLRFLPRFDYLLTDLSDYSDAYILQLDNTLLALMLILLKHHGEDDYIRNSFQLLFQSTEDLAKDERNHNLIESFYVYLAKTSKLEMDELEKLVEELPPKTKNIAMTSYDMFVATGEQKGKIEGKIEGLEEKTESAVRNMLLSEAFKTGKISIDDIADFAEVSIDYVLDIKKVLEEEAAQDSL